MIDAEAFKRKAQELLADPTPDHLGELFKYAGENYERFTPEAKALADRLWEATRPEIESTLGSLPDTPESRRLRRLYARTEGDHWDATGLIAGLEAHPSRKNALTEAAALLFPRHMQIYLDLLWDVAQRTHSGAPVVQLQLFALSADEVLAAFHLGQRGYSNQALSHVRTVFEALDLIEFFKRYPDAVFEWASLDSRNAWARFKPAAVRKKLGENPADPIYSFLSDYGPHVTWRMLKNRTAIQMGEHSEEDQTLALWVGGVPFVHNYVLSMESCLQALVLGVVKIAGVFGELLHREEAIALVRQVSEEFSHFILEHFIAWARDVGLDPSEIERFIREELPSRLHSLTK